MSTVDEVRLSVPRTAGAVDLEPEEQCDRIASLVTTLLDVPLALVSLVDSDRQFFKSQKGLAEPWGTSRESLLSHSFCKPVVERREPLIVADARRDPLLRENQAVQDLGVVGYLGVPLVTDGQALGALCAVTHEPRAWSDRDLQVAEALASALLRDIDMRLHVAAQKKSESELRASLEFNKKLAHEQSCLYRFADRLQRATNLEQLYDAALDAIQEALTCSRASILLFDNEDTMRFVGSRGLSEEYRSAVEGHSPWKKGDADPRAFGIADVRSADLDDDLKSTISNEGITALAFVPIVADGELLGKFMVYFNEPREFTSEDLDLASTIGSQIAFGVKQRRAEEELAKSENRFRQLAETMPAIVWTADSKGKLDYINQRYYIFTGADPDVIEMKAWANVVHPEDSERSRADMKRCMATGKAWEAELRTRRADGEYRWHLTRLVPMFAPDGSVSHWIGTSTDIHEVKEAERLLLSMNHELESRVQERTKELQSMNTEMQGFTYSVSHDLRAPVRAIVSTARMLQVDHSSGLSEEALVLLDRQIAAANKLGQLMDDLLRLSRLGRQPLELQEIDLTALACDVLEELPHEGAEFLIQPNLKARCDPALMRLILLNLFSNALKFQKPGSTPIVRFGTEDGTVFYVQDNGIGFEAQYHNKLFMPFERLHRDTEFPGTGIGLANVKRALERHGGSVWAVGKPNEGSTFYFTVDSCAEE